MLLYDFDELFLLFYFIIFFFTCYDLMINVLLILFAVNSLEAVFLTEVSIAGDKSRTTSASYLKDVWIKASREMGINDLDLGAADCKRFTDHSIHPAKVVEPRVILFSEGSLMTSMRVGSQILNERQGNQIGVLLVTGSLHIVSAVLGSLEG